GTAVWTVNIAGTVTVGVWNATIVTGTYGGTGVNNGSFTITVGGNFVTAGAASLPAIAQGDIWYGSATGVISALAKSTSSTRYLSNTGSSNNPAWAQVDLTNGVTGTLPYANGGCNATTQTGCQNNIFPTPTRAGDIAYWNGSNWTALAGNNSGTQV